MKPARLLIAVVLLAGLGGALWWSNKEEAAKEGQPSKDAPRILKISPDSVKQVQVKHRGEEPITVMFDDHGKWQMTSPVKLPGDSVAVAALTNATSDLNSQRVVDEKPSNLADYGLAPALIEVDITNKEGKSTKLLIGEDTAVGGNVYAKLESDPRLFLISASEKGAFNKDVVDLREKRLLSFTQDRLKRMEITANKQTIEMTRDDQAKDPRWVIAKPQATRADAGKVEELIGKLRNLSLDPTALRKATVAKPEAAFASAAPLVVIQVTDENGPKSVEVRKNKEDYFAKSTTLEGIFQVTKENAEGLDKLDELRTKKLFDFGFTDPNRIEFTDSGKKTIIEKTGEKWMSAGKTMDATSVQAFIDRLRDLASDGISKADFSGMPVVSINVSYNQGRSKEVVDIAPSAANFLARHDGGDTAVYVMSADVVKQLRQAVTDVREEQKEKKK